MYNTYRYSYIYIYQIALSEIDLITPAIANKLIYPLNYYIFYELYHSIFALMVLGKGFFLWRPYLAV